MEDVFVHLVSFAVESARTIQAIHDSELADNSQCGGCGEGVGLTALITWGNKTRHPLCAGALCGKAMGNVCGISARSLLRRARRDRGRCFPLRGLGGGS